MLNSNPHLNGRMVRYVQMTPAEWFEVPDNPRQRDTVLHAKKAVRYLAEPKPPHLEVKMAWLLDGTKIKLDGHTRAHLWRNGLIPVPDRIEVTIYQLASRQEAIDAYAWFDNAAAAERGTDVVQGAFRANGLKPQSHMLRAGRINTPLQRLYRYVTESSDQWGYDAVEEAVRFFAREIMLFDALSPTAKLFPAGLVMGALISLRRDRDDAVAFWTEYAGERGTKADGSMDAVQALIEAVMQAKAGGRGTKDLTSDLFRKALAAFFAHQKGQSYSIGGPGIRPVSDPTMKKYIHRPRHSA
jgi:hypothetical protein